MPKTLSPSFPLLSLLLLLLYPAAFAQISFPIAQSSKNSCAGSYYCGKTELPDNSDCLDAIAFYNTSYSDYNAYTSHYYLTYGSACTAIYECNKDAYLTLNGYELQELFKSIYVNGDTNAESTKTGVGAGCNICGQVWFNNDQCLVKTDYCAGIECKALYPHNGG